MSLDQVGSDRVSPSEPPVRLFQLVNTAWVDSSSAMVMITNAWLRRRSTMAPTSTAITVTTTAPRGASTSGLMPVRVATIAAAYPPRPRKTL